MDSITNHLIQLKKSGHYSDARLLSYIGWCCENAGIIDTVRSRWFKSMDPRASSAVVLFPLDEREEVKQSTLTTS